MKYPKASFNLINIILAAQSNVVMCNLKSLIEKKSLDANYNGYASCPLVTSYNKCILAEFDYNLNPMETFPFNQVCFLEVFC